MTDRSRLQRVRARLDRLPAAWILVLLGVLAQVALPVGLVVLAATGEDRVGLLVAGGLLAVTLVVVAVAVPVAVLLYLDRLPRTAALAAAVLGIGTLVVNEGHPTILPVSVALLAASVRAWAGGIDVLTLLELDPDRFERVERPDGGDPTDATPPAEDADAAPPADEDADATPPADEDAGR